MQNSNPIKEEIQQDALNKFVEHFYKNKNTRGTLCACCGYGKSYLIYKIWWYYKHNKYRWLYYSTWKYTKF